MNLADQIRRWARVGFYFLFSLTLHGVAIAQTETPSAPKKPAHPTSTAKKNPSKAHTTAKHVSTRKSTKTARGKKTSKKRGQQAIDSTRAREIQTALIREHYMQGEPSGTWDGTTQAAMQKYQADHGWQAKTTPDARALIKLGLGPNHDHLLNPESAMTSTPTENDAKVAPKQQSSDNNIPQQ
jgi:hypothetical protein